MLRLPVPPAVRVGSLLLALFASACVINPFTRTTGPRTVVEVQNDRWEALTVFLDRDGALFRLGTVEGKTSTRLDVRRDHLGNLSWFRLVAAHPDRDPHQVSQLFRMVPGDRVQWTITRTSGPTPVILPPL